MIRHIERCDTTVYYPLQSTEDHYHSIGRIHIFLFQYWDLFYSRASVFLQQRLLSSCFARSDQHRRVTCSAGCCVPFDWILQRNYSYLLTSPVPLLSIDRISRLYCLYRLRYTSPWLPVSSDGHRIASHRIASHRNGV